MRIDIVTLFPEVFEALKASIPGRAQNAGALTLRTHQLRVHAVNKHGTVDDTPYGGEAGMVLRPDPLRDALQVILREQGTEGVGEVAKAAPPMNEASDAASTTGGSSVTRDESAAKHSEQSSEKPKPHVIYMSAQGALLTQQRTAELAKLDHVVILCGHYKGVDQRFIDAYVDEEISIGDYVLSGGEVPALVLIDAVARLLPGVLGDIDSADTDSHARPGRLGWPVYTRPPDFEGRTVPEVLVSGHHANIGKWQVLESVRLTRERRPDLMEQFPLTPEERDLLDPPRKKSRKRKSATPAQQDSASGTTAASDNRRESDPDPIS